MKKISAFVMIIAIIWAIGWVLRVIAEPVGKDYSGYRAYKGGY